MPFKIGNKLGPSRGHHKVQERETDSEGRKRKSSDADIKMTMTKKKSKPSTVLPKKLKEMLRKGLEKLLN